MEVVVSAILAELAGRSISFLVDRYSNRTTPTDDETLDCLQRLLLRVHVIVEEAERRRITDHTMLRRLNTLREGMYGGYYTLDMFRSRSHKDQNSKDHEKVRHSLAMSQFNPAKRVCSMIRSSRNSGQIGKQLQQVLGSLETIVANVSEFVTFLTGCPRLSRQPYSMYMLLDKCMFGRQMEMEHIITFLLQEGGNCARKPGVLTISGPRLVGKTTLVAHACNDERVRNHFSQILSFAHGDLEDENTVALRSSGVIKHRHRGLDEERVLIIFDLDRDKSSEGLDETGIEGLLERLCSIYKSHVSCVSKIIVTSRSANIASLGTTQSLTLQPLTQEAYWYFFKARAFGSMDAAKHPKLVSIAMEMAAEMKGCMVAANIFGGLLRSNFSASFWNLVVAILRELNKISIFMLDAHQSDPWPAYTPEVTEYLVFLDDHQTDSSAHGGGIPNLSLIDVLFGGARPRGKFDVFCWKSPIPPHQSYVYSCEIWRRQSPAVARKKRSMLRDIGS